MYIKNNTIAVIFRVIFIIVCGAGIVMKLMYGDFGIAAVLGDFALISNVLALIYFAYLIIARPGYERGMLRGAVTIYMIITFVVYYYLHFSTDAMPPTNLSVAGYLLYFVAPVMAAADYLLFCRKGEFTEYNPILWALIPVLFNIAVFIINHFGFSIVKMPYFDLLGMGLAVSLLVFLGVSYLLFVLDNLMAARRR